MKNFWVKGTIILSVLAKKNFFISSKIKLFTILLYLWLQKMVVLLLDPESEILDPGWIKIRIRYKHTDPQHCFLHCTDISKTVPRRHGQQTDMYKKNLQVISVYKVTNIFPVPG
jgi:hypothetical protein